MPKSQPQYAPHLEDDQPIKVMSPMEAKAAAQAVKKLLGRK